MSKKQTVFHQQEQPLFHTQTIFPYDLFPDSLTIHDNTIEIVSTESFTTPQPTKIPLHDIVKIDLHVSSFFATLRILSIHYPLRPITLNYLQIDKAKRAKTLMETLIKQARESMT